MKRTGIPAWVLVGEEIVDDINCVLAKHAIRERISLEDISITERIVSDLIMSEPQLSGAIVNHLWPSVADAEVYHYTSRSAAQSIFSERLFRLTNIGKRISEGEIRTFCETHDLRGYLMPDTKGRALYLDLLAPNTFYASF